MMDTLCYINNVIYTTNVIINSYTRINKSFE